MCDLWLWKNVPSSKLAKFQMGKSKKSTTRWFNSWPFDPPVGSHFTLERVTYIIIPNRVPAELPGTFFSSRLRFTSLPSHANRSRPSPHITAQLQWPHISNPPKRLAIWEKCAINTNRLRSVRWGNYINSFQVYNRLIPKKKMHTI